MDAETKPEEITTDVVAAESDSADLETLAPALPPKPSSPLMAQRRRSQIYSQGDPNLPKFPARTGRPKKFTIAESEWEAIRAFVYCGATKREIAAYYRITPETLAREAEVRGVNWDEFVTDARTAARLNLRRKLWKLALSSGKGSVQAILALAKSELVLNDTTKVEHTGKDGGPIQVNSLTATMTTEQLQSELKQLLAVIDSASPSPSGGDEETDA